MESINPYNNEVIQTFKEHDEDEITLSIQKAEEAYQNWKSTAFDERRSFLLLLASQLRQGKDRYAKIMTQEMGKLLKEAIGEVEKCAWVCEYYAENGEQFLQKEQIDTDAGKSYVQYQPLGVVLAVMPWNFPFWQVFRFAAPAIMAGNTIVLKHASNVSQCALVIEELFEMAGAIDGLFKTLLISSKKVGSVIDNSSIKAITLTGSELAGSKVAERAGRNIKKSVLELGGSDAFIVLEDADLEEAVSVAVTSRFLNCGQSCIAAKRFIVVESIAENFLELFSSKVKDLVIGDPMNEEVDIGPMARIDLAKELDEQVKKSIELGAILEYGGERNEAFYSPTILSHVSKGMPAYEEELFGPVAAVIIVGNADEAIKVANSSKFGLGGSVWTTDLVKGEAIAQKVETGSMFVNGLVKSDPRLPFGGIKSSGYGRELSYLGIKEFTNPKTIWIK